MARPQSVKKKQNLLASMDMSSRPQLGRRLHSGPAVFARAVYVRRAPSIL